MSFDKQVCAKWAKKEKKTIRQLHSCMELTVKCSLFFDLINKKCVHELCMVRSTLTHHNNAGAKASSSKVMEILAPPTTGQDRMTR